MWPDSKPTDPKTPTLFLVLEGLIVKYCHTTEERESGC